MGALAAALAALALAPLGSDAARAGGTAAAAAAALEQVGVKLPAAGEEARGRLGSSAALSADGSTLIVGAPKDGPGAAYVYTRNGSTWEQQGSKLTAGEVPGGEGGGEATSEECAEEPSEPGEEADECAFGTSVALSADGDTALVGEPSATSAPGAAWVFTRSGGAWTRTAVLLGGDEGGDEGRFGRSVALSADGATALVGVPSGLNGRGGAWVFTGEGSTWTRDAPELEDEEPRAPVAHFGRSVALSADGATALIGGPGYANYTGAAWTFTHSGGDWELGKLVGEGVAVDTHFGKSVALSGDGSTALVGAPDAEGDRGAVWAFARTSTGGYAEQGGELRANEGEGSDAPETEARFGVSLALSGDGNVALVGAPHANKGTGVVAVLTRSGETWSRLPQGLVGKEASLRSWTGTSVALSGSGTVAAIGAPRDRGLAGAAWVFEEGSGEAEKEKEEEEEKTKSKEEEPETTTETPGKSPEGSSKAAGGAAAGGVQAFVVSGGGCRVSVAKKRLAVTRYRSVALRLVRTGAGPCSGSIAISYRIRGTRRSYALRTIGTARFSIPPGTSRVVTVELSEAGQKWLRVHKGKGNASLAIARVVPAPTVAQSASVRLNLKEARRAATVAR